MAKDRKAFELVCNDIAITANGLHFLCEKHGIAVQTFYNWMNDDSALLEMYTRARDMQADLLADQIIQIADTTEEGTKTVLKPTGEETTTGDMTEHRRLKIESRKWIAAKLKPKKYGDKVDVTSGGEKINAILPPFMKANESES